MSIGMVVHEQQEQMRRVREQALSEGKSPEEANRLADKAGEDFGATIVTGLSRAASYGLTGMAVGSVVPVVGTTIGGVVGVATGVVSAIVDPNPSFEKAARSYVSIFTKIFKPHGS